MTVERYNIVPGEHPLTKRVLSRDEEREIVIAYLAGHPIKKISDVYYLSRSGVYRVLERSGIETTRKRKNNE